LKRALLFFLALFFLVGVLLLFLFGHFLITPAGKGGQDLLFVVPEGSSLKEVAIDLEEKTIISNKSLFLLWARFTGYSRIIKAGEYRLNSGMPPLKILGILGKGAVISHMVTIPEGFSSAQIAELLERKGLVEKGEFLLVAGDQDLARRYNIAGAGLEGYLYPDTYRFDRGVTALSVLDVMVKRFKEVTAPFGERAKQLGMAFEDIVTLASIVEKETGLAEERPVIASVFLNRLKRGMRLESDPTVIYGILGFNGNLTRKDLSKPTPYNTYLIRGLPPGPIANPGRDAIKAVLFPAKTNYLYFVSKNDGSHYFSRTLAEHNRAVRIYQKNRRTRRRKAS
ncbi:MAG: endolytic transglycosylase MltG, partial [Deltaproteobacteria bacterium]|nr:endolytic transglycosylase MltG [Deltaproteobacteria bacterium]